MPNLVQLLIDACQAGQHGFELAARNLSDPLLKAEFMQYAFQNQRFANQLAEAQWNLLSPDKSVVQTPPWWTEVIKAAAESDPNKIIQTCEQVSDSVARVYDSINVNDLPPQVASVVRMQAAAAQRVLSRLRMLQELNSPHPKQ